MNWLCNLLVEAKIKNWCVKPSCTTCGSREFRTQLGKKSQDEIIEALKQLTEEVVFEHSEALHLIFLVLDGTKNTENLTEKLLGTPCHQLIDLFRLQLGVRLHVKQLKAEAELERAAIGKQKEIERIAKIPLRLAEKSARDLALAIEKSRLEEMHFIERLAAISDPNQRFSVDAIGYSTLFYGAPDFSDLAEDARQRLISIIGNRPGTWRKVKNSLSQT